MKEIWFLEEDDRAVFSRSFLIGAHPASANIVARVGVVTETGERVRIDVAEAPAYEYVCFQDVRLAGGKAYIGYGERVLIVDLITGQAVTFQMNKYFSHLFDAEDMGEPVDGFAVLATSLSEVFAFGLDGELLWKTGDLGIDGVIVHAATSSEIEGSGEWDPPGGWEPFVLATSTGELISGGKPAWYVRACDLPPRKLT